MKSTQSLPSSGNQLFVIAESLQNYVGVVRLLQLLRGLTMMIFVIRVILVARRTIVATGFFQPPYSSAVYRGSALWVERQNHVKLGA